MSENASFFVAVHIICCIFAHKYLATTCHWTIIGRLSALHDTYFESDRKEINEDIRR